MKPARERRAESQTVAQKLCADEISYIEKLMDTAVAEGSTSICLNHYPSKDAIQIMQESGYNIADHSSQREGTDIEISWD